MTDTWLKEFKTRGPKGIAPRGLGCHLADLADAETGEIRLTQGEMAEGLGTDRSTVNHNLKRLRDANWVAYKGHSYWLEVPDQSGAEAESSVAESNTDVAQGHNDVAESNTNVGESNTDVAQGHTDVALSNTPTKENVSPTPPSKEKTSTAAAKGAREEAPHPDRDSTDLNQWILTRLQEHELEPDLMTPYQIIDRLREGPLDRELWRSYLADDIPDKAERAELPYSDEHSLRKRQALKYLGRSTDVMRWKKQRDSYQNNGSGGPSNSVNNGFMSKAEAQGGAL